MDQNSMSRNIYFVEGVQGVGGCVCVCFIHLFYIIILVYNTLCYREGKVLHK